MLFKLYKNVFSEEPPEERRELFAKFYKTHEVELIGVWSVKENPLIKYMLTRFRDEDHYRDFVNDIQKNRAYVEMTKRVDEVRLENEVIDLVPDGLL